MFTAQEVRRVFSGADFAAPASAEDIAEAERLLDCRLPPQLRLLYLEFDGFLGPTNAPFLLPVLRRPGGGESLTSYTQFFRSESYFPEWLRQAIVFGDNGTGAAWFLLLNEGNRLVRWDAEWEEYESVEGSILDAWRREKELYDSFRRDV